MDKQEYLSLTNERIQSLVDDDTFNHNLAQVRSRATQEELLPELPATEFNFEPEKIWKYCDYIFSEGALLLREDFGDREATLAALKKAAQAFEFLAKFAAEDERERLLLNSAMCYHIAGYQANAQCVVALVKSEQSALQNSREGDREQLDSRLIALFRNNLIQFLKREIDYLRTETSRAISSVRGMQKSVTQGVSDQTLSTKEIFNLTAHAFYHQALHDMSQYCLSGVSNNLLVAKRHLQKSHEYFQKVGDTTLGVITSELRAVVEEFEERSTWANIRKHGGQLLESPIWQLYLRNLAFEDNIVEFWLSQLKAIRAGLLTNDDSYVVQMPTSAGKTLIAELAILTALTKFDNARCLYIAPYRALVNEIKSNLADRLGAVGFSVSNLIGGFEFDAFQDYLLAESQVLVATPEKVELLLRTHPEYFERLAVVVIDEGHILDEGISTAAELAEQNISLREKLHEDGTLGRGPLLELLITRLRRKLPDTRFLFLSAVMPEVNADDFVDWLARSENEPLKVSKSDRPSRQAIAKFEWKTPKNGQLQYLNLPKLPDGQSPFVPYFIQRNQYYTGNRTPRGRRQRRSWPDTDNKTQSTATLAARFAKTGPVLVFCAQTSDVRNVTNNVITTLQYLEASQLLPRAELGYKHEPELESYYLALEWLGDEHELTQALHYGVGLHYGPLPDPVRQAVEDDFRANRIHILVCTNTLAQGVNMPIKTAIIYSLERRWITTEPGKQELHQSKIKKRDFWNVCGRAGRAGRETEGQVVFMKISRNDEVLLQEYMDESNIEPVDSALYKLLLALLERRIDQSELTSFLSSHVLTILAEEVVDTEDENDVRDFLGSSLVGIQAIRNDVDISPLVAAIQSTARWTVDQVPDPGLRTVFSSTGLSVSSCLTLEKAAESFLEKVNRSTLTELQTVVTLDEDLLEATVRVCTELSEISSRRIERDYQPENEYEIILNWVHGISVRELRTEHWQKDQPESLSKYISQQLTYKLPWGANGFLQILAHALELEYDELPMTWQHLPSMLKFGVGTVYACWACSLGVSSRKMAQQIAEAYEYQQTDDSLSFPDFANWFINLPTDFVLKELDGFQFEKERLLSNITELVSVQQHVELFQQKEITLDSPIQGLDYQSGQHVVQEIRVGEHVTLERDTENPYDRYAVKVLYDDIQIGYVKRDIARLVSQEMKLGRRVDAVVDFILPALKPFSAPQVGIRIIIS